MTVREVASQLMGMAVDGHFNGQKFSERELRQYIEGMFESGVLKLKDRLVMEITLPDGNWIFTVNHFNDEWDGYDYTIPETREEENWIWDMLLGVE